SNNNGAEPFGGRVGPLAMFPAVLTNAQRLWLCNSGKGRTYAQVVATRPDLTALWANRVGYWYEFDELAGTRVERTGHGAGSDQNMKPFRYLDGYSGAVGSAPGIDS